MAYDHVTVTVTHRLLTLTHKMKSFVAVLALVAVAAADVSHLRSPEADAQVVKQSADVGAVAYAYGYETSNGISGQEQGALANVGKENEGIAVSGSNAYTAPGGEKIETFYTADEFGYHPQGAHLPTPPPPQPIPDYIIKALDYIAAHPPQPEPIRRV